MGRCRVLLLKQKTKNCGTSDSLRENHAVENQAKGFETHGLDFTPNKQAVQNEKEEKNTKCPKKSGCVLPSLKHFPSSSRVSAKLTGAYDYVEGQQELPGHWEALEDSGSPGHTTGHTTLSLVKGLSLYPEIDILESCQGRTV